MTLVTLFCERWLTLTQTCCVRTARLHGGSELVFRIPTPGGSFATDEQSSWSAPWISRQAPPNFTRSVGTKSVACSRAHPLMSWRWPLGGSVSPVSAVIRRSHTSWYRAPDREPGRGGVDHAQPRWWSRRPHSGCLSPPGWYAPGRPAREVSPPTTTPPFWVWNRDGGASLAGREPSVPHVPRGTGLAAARHDLRRETTRQAQGDMDSERVGHRRVASVSQSKGDGLSDDRLAVALKS